MRRWWVVPLLLIASACRTIPVDDASVRPVAERQAELLGLDNWQAKGSIALSSPTTGISGSLDWLQQRQDFTVALTAALGQGLKVTQRGELATLTTRGKAPATGPSAEALILDELRVRIPLRQLSFWIRGLPGNEGEPAFDRFGRLIRLKYLDLDGVLWRAKFERYVQINTLDLPALIQVNGGDYEIRVLIKSWEPRLPSLDVDTQPEKQPSKRIVIPGVSS